MEMELKNLIDKIKKEGVEKAESDAGNIVRQAQTKAQQVIDDAEKRKATLLQEGEARLKAFQASTEEALKQSARDALLALRDRVTEFFGRVVKDRVSEQLTDDALKEIIIKAVEGCIKHKSMDVEVLLSDKDKKRLEKILFNELTKEAKERLKVKAGRSVEKGFRIGEQGKDSYLDFTDQAIADGFKRYLNPKLVEMLDIDLGLNSQKQHGK